MVAGSGGCQLASGCGLVLRTAGCDAGDRASLWGQVAGEGACDGILVPLATFRTLEASDGGGHHQGLVEGAGQEQMM